MSRVLWIEGQEVNALLGRQVLEPRNTYPITFMDNLSFHPYARYRCQIMDIPGGSRCYFVTIPISRLMQLPETDYDFGFEWY